MPSKSPSIYSASREPSAEPQNDRTAQRPSGRSAPTVEVVQGDFWLMQRPTSEAVAGVIERPSASSRDASIEQWRREVEEESSSSSSSSYESSVSLFSFRH